jgi:hypothetical protein
MSSEPSSPTAPPPDGGDDNSRLNISAITEMPAGHDAELATIFREMRRAAGISTEQVAGRLATPVETIEALENGALLALPEWPELTRIITAYAAQLGLDSRPILRRLEGQLGASKTAAAAPAPAAQEAFTPDPSTPKPARPASAGPSGPPMPPSAMPPPPPTSAPPPQPRRSPLPQPPGAAPPPQPQQSPPQQQAQPYTGEAVLEPEEKPKRRMARFIRPLINWVVLIGFVAALGSSLWYAAKHPRMVWTALDTLPEPIPRAMRSVWNFMRPLETEPARPQVSDPDNRKSDKLP